MVWLLWNTFIIAHAAYLFDEVEGVWSHWTVCLYMCIKRCGMENVFGINVQLSAGEFKGLVVRNCEIVKY